jgi:hypothetical protein
MLLALAAYQTGDTAPRGPRPSRRSDWHRGPRSSWTERSASRSACAATPTPASWSRAAGARPRATSARRRGGTVGCPWATASRSGRALRAYQAKGGRFLASDQPFSLMRFGDRAMGDALLAGTPATFGVERRGHV